ncbi:MAG: hypothetical protein V3V00_00745 [Saprospiraceae bacterium]
MSILNTTTNSGQRMRASENILKKVIFHFGRLVVILQELLGQNS